MRFRTLRGFHDCRSAPGRGLWRHEHVVYAWLGAAAREHVNVRSAVRLGRLVCSAVRLGLVCRHLYGNGSHRLCDDAANRALGVGR